MNFFPVGLPPTIHNVLGIWGDARGNVYARASGGGGDYVLQLDGGALEPLVVDLEGTAGTFRVSPAGTIYVVTNTGLMMCSANCKQLASWTYASGVDPNDNVKSVCLAGEKPYFSASTALGQLAVYVPNGAPPTTWSRVALGTISSSLVGGCTLSADGGFYVAATGGVGTYVSGAGSVVAVDGGATSQVWRDVRALGDRVVLVGNSCSVAELQPNGGWEFVSGYVSGSGAHLTTIAGVNPAEIFALGQYDANLGGNLAISQWGGPWQFWNYPNLDVNTAWSPDDNHLFIGGQLLSTAGGIIGGAVFLGSR